MLGSLILTSARSAHADENSSKAMCASTHEQGQRLWKTDQIKKAIELLSRCAEQACPAVVQSDCAAWLLQAKGELPAVRVVVTSADGSPMGLQRVWIDGVMQNAAQAIEVDPGRHAVKIETLDGIGTSSEFYVKRGERDKLVAIELRVPKPQPPAPAVSTIVATPSPNPPVGTRMSRAAAPYAYGLGAVAIACAGAFAGFGLAGRAKEQDMQRTCSPNCAASEVDAMHRDYVVADVFLGLAIVATGVSLGVVHLWREPATSTTASVRFGPGNVSIEAMF